MDPLGAGLKPGRPTWAERRFGDLAGLGLGLLCLLVSLSVVSRWVYRSLVPDEVLWVQELMVVVVLAPLVLVTAAREHIEVTIFTKAAGAGTQRVLACLGHLVGLVFVGFLAWAAWRLFLGAWESGEYYEGDLRMPHWLGYGLFFAGLAAFGLRLLAMLGRDLLAERDR